MHGLLVGPTELVAVDQPLVRIETLPLAWLPLAVGEDVDGDAQDVGQAVQLTLGDVVTVERLLGFQELEELPSIRDGFLSELASLSPHLNLDNKCQMSN